MIKNSWPKWINLQGWSEMGRAASWLVDEGQQKQPELTTAYVMHCSSPPGVPCFHTQTTSCTCVCAATCVCAMACTCHGGEAGTERLLYMFV